MSGTYVHGYSEGELTRLSEQAATLVDLLHEGTGYPPGSRVLEAGCGIGAQTVTLARRSPGARIVSVDFSEESLVRARQRVREAGVMNVEFLRADIHDLPFGAGEFDHVFLCFVLEHLPEAGRALRRLKEVLKPGGTLTAIEGDHGSTFFHPDNESARQSIAALVELQRRKGGDAHLGRRLYPFLVEGGFRDVQVRPLMVYADGRRPDLQDGFTLRTFAAMVGGVEAEALRAGLMDRESWDRGIRGLRRAAEPDGVFCYTFFKGVGLK